MDSSREFHRAYLKQTGFERLVFSRDNFWAEHLKATPERVKILDLLKESHLPLSAKQILDKAPDVHLATIYRTLNALVAAGTLWRVYPRTRKQAAFELRPVIRKTNIFKRL